MRLLKQINNCFFTTYFGHQCVRLHINCNSWLRKRFSCVTASITFTGLSLLDLHWEWNSSFYPKMKNHHYSKRSYNIVCTQSQEFNICFPFANYQYFLWKRKNNRMRNWWLTNKSDSLVWNLWQNIKLHSWNGFLNLTKDWRWFGKYLNSYWKCLDADSVNYFGVKELWRHVNIFVIFSVTCCSSAERLIFWLCCLLVCLLVCGQIICCKKLTLGGSVLTLKTLHRKCL